MKLNLQTADGASGFRSSCRKFPNNVRPIDGGMALAQEGRKEAIPLLNAAKQMGLTPALQNFSHPIIVRTLANSTAMLAKVWFEAYTLAGSPVLDTANVGKAPVPPYVPLDYIPGASLYSGPPFMADVDGDEAAPVTLRDSDGETQ